MRNLNITFEDKDFKQLENMKEEWKILGAAETWEDFLLKLAGIRK